MEPTSPDGAVVAATSGGGSPSPGAAPPPRPEIPAPARGVELLGQQPGSGYRQAPSLARRADGQTIQLTPVLYAVLEAVDGRRSYEEVAAAASQTTGRLISADDARHLSENKLRPLGLLRLADGSDPEVRKQDPLLGLRFR